MYSSKNADSHFAKLTGDALYKKAQAAVKKLNPTVADVISIDRDSLNITMYGSKAQFSFVRTKNGVPVSNDRGSIVLEQGHRRYHRLPHELACQCVFQGQQIRYLT